MEAEASGEWLLLNRIFTLCQSIGVLTTKGEMRFHGGEVKSDHLHQVSQAGITSRGTIITARPASSCLLYCALWLLLPKTFNLNLISLQIYFSVTGIKGIDGQVKLHREGTSEQILNGAFYRRAPALFKKSLSRNKKRWEDCSGLEEREPNAVQVPVYENQLYKRHLGKPEHGLKQY